MTAQMKIDQAGLSPAGAAGKARLDGKADGALVTLTSVSPGSTNTFRLLYVPPDDDVALDSLVPVGGGATPVWTFSPKAGVRGPYLIELITDLGQSNESRTRKIFGIKGWRTGLVAPALNESGDPGANATLIGADYTNALRATDRNVTADGSNTIDGWQRCLLDMVAAIERGNYSQVVVPAGVTLVVPSGQQMLYKGGLRGDYRGDLVEAGGGGGATEQDYDFELFWNASADNGAFSGSDVIHDADFDADIGRINKYNLGTGDVVATLPPAPTGTNPLYNRRIAFREMGGVLNGTLTIQTSGDDTIATPDNPSTAELNISEAYSYIEFQNFNSEWIEVARHPPVGVGATKPWSSVFSASGTLQPGVMNRYDGNVAGMTLTFPAPIEGMEIEVMNTGGPSAGEEVVIASGNGNTLVLGNITTDTSVTVSNPGFVGHWKWDSGASKWQLLRFYFAEIG